ncbi:porin family protein [Aquimarina mytili]|uniref:PorT family protein n=1 Tax=Aquimarina mytili TaxID=874423 RepID=A0A936ZXM9_9FLAO|nr:porin family protein [Aquimarina mytili]MBL0682996.1 PorT family protein [Aquimarina mytili]
MIKRLLLVIVLASFSIVANAQEEKIRFGAKAGLNFASLNGDGISGLSGLTSFHIGAVVEVPIAEKLAFQPELVYSSQGYQFDTVVFDGFLGALNVDSTTKLNYINIPIMAKYYVAQGLSIQAGPQIGILVSAKTKADTAGFSTEVDVDDFVKTIDYGVNFGAGYQLDMGLFFDARYNLGLSNINDGFGSGLVKNQNSVIQLSAGYKF